MTNDNIISSSKFKVQNAKLQLKNQKYATSPEEKVSYSVGSGVSFPTAGGVAFSCLRR